MGRKGWDGVRCDRGGAIVRAGEAVGQEGASVRKAVFVLFPSLAWMDP